MGNGSGTMMAMAMMMVVVVGAFGFFYFRSNKPVSPPDTGSSDMSIPGYTPTLYTTQPDVRVTNVSYDFDNDRRRWRDWYWPKFSVYGLFSDDFEDFLDWVIDKKRSNKDIKKWLKKRLKDRGRFRDEHDRDWEKNWDRDFDRDWNDDWEKRDRNRDRDRDYRDSDRYKERHDDDQKSDRRFYNGGEDFQKNQWQSKRGGGYRPIGWEL